MLTASGWARCSSPHPQASVAISSGVELAVGGRHREEFEAAHPLGGAGLVGVDVRGGGGDDGAPARQHGGERDDVRARAVEHRESLGGVAELGLDHLLQAFGVDVLAVGDLVATVRRGQRLEHLGVHSRVVVAREAAVAGVVEGVDHGLSLPAGAAASFAPSQPPSAEDNSTGAPCDRSTTAYRGSTHAWAPLACGMYEVWIARAAGDIVGRCRVGVADRIADVADADGARADRRRQRRRGGRRQERVLLGDAHARARHDGRRTQVDGGVDGQPVAVGDQQRGRHVGVVGQVVQIAVDHHGALRVAGEHHLGGRGTAR